MLIITSVFQEELAWPLQPALAPALVHLHQISPLQISRPIGIYFDFRLWYE